ncbi:hypothetical protein VTL71DRAFT_14912 [Oculimacula yallundae]|uniref:Uncharacterized protein n=1 Tax=Oculimacula yallundae TaxID=86028 RepID=A0ABR4CFN8_9HELO
MASLRQKLSMSNSKLTPNAPAPPAQATSRYRKSLERYSRVCSSYTEDADRYLVLANAYLKQIKTFDLELGVFHKSSATLQLTNLPMIPNMPRLPIDAPGGQSVDAQIILESKKIVEAANSKIAWSTNEVALANFELQKKVQSIKDDAAKERLSMMAVTNTTSRRTASRRVSATLRLHKAVSRLDTDDTMSHSTRPRPRIRKHASIVEVEGEPMLSKKQMSMRAKRPITTMSATTATTPQYQHLFTTEKTFNAPTAISPSLFAPNLVSRPKKR